MTDGGEIGPEISAAAVERVTGRTDTSEYLLTFGRLASEVERGRIALDRGGPLKRILFEQRARRRPDVRIPIEDEILLLPEGERPGGHGTGLHRGHEQFRSIGRVDQQIRHVRPDGGCQGRPTLEEHAPDRGTR